MNREFGYRWFHSRVKGAGIHFVARLNIARHPTFTDKEGRRKRLSLAPRRGSFLEGFR